MTIESEDYFKDFLRTKVEKKFNDIFEDSVTLSNVGFQTSSIGTDLIYATMHIVAQRLLLQLNFDKRNSSANLSLLDVGSQFSFISFAASFFDVTFIEPRTKSIRFQSPGLCNIIGMSGEAQNLPLQDNSFDFVTSFHAIEHFGLGRYGDNLDYFGDQKGLIEFARVLKPGGYLLTGVPASKKSNIEFNGQRKYKPKDFDNIVLNAGLKKMNGLISYCPGIFSDDSLVGAESSIEEYPENFTPPVYIAAYKK